MLKTSTACFLVSLALPILLFTGCEDDDLALSPTVSSGFEVTADALIIEAGQSIAYRDASGGGVRWSWDFEGGSPAASIDRSPRITYDNPGAYVTTLFTYFNDGSRRRHSLRPKVLPIISPNFSVSAQRNAAGSSVAFTNLTTGEGDLPAIVAESDTLIFYEWTFTGGTPTTSTASNPSVTYTEAGTFDVSLKVIRPITGSEETTTKTGFIEIE